uniref:Uncharacterized protein n=1 Tax=Caenorhabditis japonica TaxID=281687 RepID=A0A8R1IBY3_CAEJA
MEKQVYEKTEKRTYPDLKFDAFVTPEYGFHFEVDSYCGDERRGERVIAVAEQERESCFGAHSAMKLDAFLQGKCCLGQQVEDQFLDYAC